MLPPLLVFPSRVSSFCSPHYYVYMFISILFFSCRMIYIDEAGDTAVRIVLFAVLLQVVTHHPVFFSCRLSPVFVCRYSLSPSASVFRSHIGCDDHQLFHVLAGDSENHNNHYISQQPAVFIGSLPSLLRLVTFSVVFQDFRRGSLDMPCFPMFSTYFLTTTHAIHTYRVS